MSNPLEARRVGEMFEAAAKVATSVVRIVVAIIAMIFVAQMAWAMFPAVASVVQALAPFMITVLIVVSFAALVKAVVRLMW